MWILLSLLLFYLLLFTRNTISIADSYNNNEIYRNHVHLQANRRIELLQMANIQRQDRLQQVCNARNLTSKTYHQLTEEQMDHLIIDKQYKLLYCYIPKVSFFVLLFS